VRHSLTENQSANQAALFGSPPLVHSGAPSPRPTFSTRRQQEIRGGARPDWMGPGKNGRFVACNPLDLQIAPCLGVVLLVMGPCRPTSPRVQRINFRFADNQTSDGRIARFQHSYEGVAQ
jgi:hypothetical protein